MSWCVSTLYWLACYPDCLSQIRSPATARMRMQGSSSIHGKVKSAYKPSGSWHQARACSGFSTMKWLGVFLLPTGWAASPLQGYPQHIQVLVHLGGESHSESKVFCPRTQLNGPGQGLHPDHLLWSWAANHEATAPSTSNILYVYYLFSSQKRIPLDLWADKSNLGPKCGETWKRCKITCLKFMTIKHFDTPYPTQPQNRGQFLAEYLLDRKILQLQTLKILTQ